MLRSPQKKQRGISAPWTPWRNALILMFACADSLGSCTSIELRSCNVRVQAQRAWPCCIILEVVYCKSKGASARDD